MTTYSRRFFLESLVAIPTIGGMFTAQGEEDLPKTEADFEPLFDGKTLSGWEGKEGVFRVEDAAIVGGSLASPIPQNEFLCTTREFGDFELRLQVRLLGENANAGIQIRSRRIPEHHEMIGYQADMGQGYWGALYDESRRKRVLSSPDADTLEKALKPGEWNDYSIHCAGKCVKLWLNGVPTVDYMEEDASIEQKGILGLQIHSGPPSEAWYRNIRIRVLPERA